MKINEHYSKKEKVYPDFDDDKAVKMLSEFIQCKSVSYIDQTKMDFNEFKKIHSIIDNNFKNISKYAIKHVINEGSVYYFIQGKNEKLPSLVLMGHLDVVPPIKENEWEYGPFSGKITEKYIYGRGSLDMKHIDCANLSAVDYFLGKYGLPERSIYLCFGHDEETLGMKGQFIIKEDLKKNKANIGMVVDEGGGFLDGTDFQSNATLCHIQVMEKGYLDLELKAVSSGGHSSRPGKTTALGRVAHAIAKIEDTPFECKLNDPLKMFYKNIENTVSNEALKGLIGNMDNNEEALVNYLKEDESKLPLLQTSIAATMIESDSKGANVLPQEVKAVINFRLSNFDKVNDIVSKIKGICDKYDVTVKVMNNIEASPISSITSKEYKLLENLIYDYFKDVVVVPNITVGGTDCCFYNDICSNCYRFSPIIESKELSKGVHGVNEHIEISSYLYGIQFYISLLEKYCL